MKHILITGSSGGMGKAICKLLIKKGYQVYGLDCKENDKIERLNFIQCDVTDLTSVEAALKKVNTFTEKLDGIIHTAGIYDLDSLLEMDEERFLRIFNINLFGVYRINKTFTPLLNRNGRIIITTSELAPLDPLPFTGIYGITKSALEKYAYSLRMEVNLLGIFVSVIRPGAVKTDLLNDSTQALDRFCINTQMYHCNANKFQKIVNSIESRNVTPDAIARLALKALESRRPKFVYNINRNFLLKLLNFLPDSMQVAIIKMILRT